MSDRFSGLIKLPQQPARRILATAGAKIDTRLDSPATAPVEIVLAELASKNAIEDMLMLLACALPPRERVWWSCLAARDVIDPVEKPPLPLTTSEAWVFKPNEDNRAAAMRAIELAEPADDTVHCASGVAFFDGTLGAGDLAQYTAPAGAAELSAFAMNIIAYCRDAAKMDEMGQVLIDRALDIARGGPGKIDAPPMTPEDPEDEELFEDDDDDEVDEEPDDVTPSPVAAQKAGQR